ncbi:DUF4142 domain-containing protein [Pontibacter ruber]|uniref:DUF4142 domain-containing protein n=1 Tax=Pontibacter ruber TaxID=1343895 RepID=A0ABW5CTG7_9BACT|nr:DUF4142 domain-containing protein [Pontibacter ruber]
MKLQGWKLLLLLVPFIGFSACDDDDDDDQIDVMTSAEFVEQAATSDTFEIETANLALQKSTMREVQEFAQELLNDHTASRTQLRTLARQKGIEEPTTLPQDRALILDKLAGRTGVAFDKDFANIQLQAHEDAINLYEKAADQLEDQNLRAFAEQQLPILRRHLDHAQVLKAKTDQL